VSADGGLRAQGGGLGANGFQGYSKAAILLQLCWLADAHWGLFAGEGEYFFGRADVKIVGGFEFFLF